MMPETLRVKGVYLSLNFAEGIFNDNRPLFVVSNSKLKLVSSFDSCVMQWYQLCHELINSFSRSVSGFV